MKRITGVSHADMCVYDFLRMSYVPDMFQRKSKHIFHVQYLPPPRKSCRLCNNVENMVQANRPQITLYSACALDAE